MSKWKQVSGDMDFSGVGCVLAKNNPGSRSVDLVKIEPWLELDSSALREGYGFWDVSSDTVDYENMSVDRDEVQSALKFIGMTASEYKKLEPVYKAEIIASYSGYGESNSTSDFADALPVPIVEIEFYAKGKNDVEGINDSMRREVVNKLYGGKYSDRKLPSDKALELAFGEKERTFELDEDEARALRYAMIIGSGYTRALEKKVKVADWKAMKSLLETLAAAPESGALPSGQLEAVVNAYGKFFELDWEDKREQALYYIDEDAKDCHRLIEDLLGELGF